MPSTAQNELDSLYDPLFLDGYDAYLYSHYNFDYLSRTIAQQVVTRNCKTVLDCAAGIGGDVALGLSKLGVDVDCIDPSPLMVERFRNSARKKGISQEIYHLPWDKLSDLRKQYDYVMCQSNSLVYGPAWDGKRVPTEQDIAEFIKNFASVLRPGGYLHIDAPWRRTLERYESAISTSKTTELTLQGSGQIEKIVVAEQIRDEVNKRLWQCSLSIYPKSDAPSRTYVLERYSGRVTVQDIPKILRECGFENIQIMQLPGTRSIHGTIIAQKRQFSSSDSHAQDNGSLLPRTPRNAHRIPGARVGVVSGGSTSRMAQTYKTAQEVSRVLTSLGYQVTTLDASDPASLTPGIEGLPVIFNAIHGAFGEDGGLKSLCDVLKKPLTGPTAAIHALCYDRALLKSWAQQKGIRVPQESLRSFPSPTASPVVVRERLRNDTEASEVLENDATSLLTHAQDKLYERYEQGRPVSVCMFDGSGYEFPLVTAYRESDALPLAKSSERTEGLSFEILSDRSSPQEEYVRTETRKLYDQLETHSLLQFNWLLPDDKSQPILLGCVSNPELGPYTTVGVAASAAGMNFESLVERILINAS